MIKQRCHKITFLLLSVYIVAIISVICVLRFSYSEKNIIDTINNYITVRYNNVSIDNIDISLSSQKKYLSDKLLSKSSNLYSDNNIEASKTYFKETQFRTKILTSVVERKSYNKYEAKVAVLYYNDYMKYDNIVNYVFEFTVNKKGINTYVFDNVEMVSDTTTHINGREIHTHDGEAVILDGHDHEHHDCKIEH